MEHTIIQLQLVAGASVIMEYSALWFTLHEVSSRSAKLHSVLSKSVPIYICMGK